MLFRSTDNGKYNDTFSTLDMRLEGGIADSDDGVMRLRNTSTEGTAPVLSIHGTDDVVNAQIFGSGDYNGSDYYSLGTKVVGRQRTGLSAMTNVDYPANLNANTVNVAELADIVGRLLNALRAHGLVAD